jgi:hypothetical protein
VRTSVRAGFLKSTPMHPPHPLSMLPTLGSVVLAVLGASAVVVVGGRGLLGRDAQGAAAVVLFLSGACVVAQGTDLAYSFAGALLILVINATPSGAMGLPLLASLAAHNLLEGLPDPHLVRLAAEGVRPAQVALAALVLHNGGEGAATAVILLHGGCSRAKTLATVGGVAGVRALGVACAAALALPGEGGALTSCAGGALMAAAALELADAFAPPARQEGGLPGP